MDSPAFTSEQFDVERKSFERSPAWELRNIRTALTSFRFLNTPEQEARLAAVKAIQSDRAQAKRKKSAR